MDINSYRHRGTAVNRKDFCVGLGYRHNETEMTINLIGISGILRVFPRPPPLFCSSAAGKFVVFLAKFLKQMVQNLGIWGVLWKKKLVSQHLETRGGGSR